MFKRSYGFFFSFIFVNAFAQALLPLWYLKNGADFSILLLLYVVTFGSSFLTLFVLQRTEIQSRTALRIGLLLNGFAVAISAHYSNFSQVLISGALIGIAIPFFWVTYNILHFKFGKREYDGLSSGAYFLLGPLLGVLSIPIAGSFAHYVNFTLFFGIGALLYSIPIAYTFFLPDITFSFDVRSYISTHRIDWTLVLQGVANRMTNVLIPTFTLVFIQEPAAFGSFFGYLSIIAALAGIINGYISDKVRNRRAFFYISTVGVIVGFVPLIFATNNFVAWGISAGIVGLAINLAAPFWLVYAIDQYSAELSIEKLMTVREIYLHVGYVFGLLVALSVFLITKSPQITIASIAGISVALPFVARLSKVYSKPV